MDYKATLNLPRTGFPMKADLPKREPDMLAAWQQADLYGQIRRAAHPAGTFILHDGPPYANGDIHIGHALNKILKDIIVRYKTMRGYDAPYVPGWDCHGMPIEHQLFKELKLTKHQITQTDFRLKARAYAERYVGIQREQFKRLGVLGDWDRPYLTMAKEYELTMLRTFAELLGQGFITYDQKPVYWCATCETALADAEVEYEDRSDTSVYVAFPIKKIAMPIVQDSRWSQASVIVWTTTPWTLPAHVALCMHPQASYALVRAKRRADRSERFVVLADNLAERVLDRCGFEAVERIQSVDGTTLAGSLAGGGRTLVCRAPFSDRESVGVTSEGVSLKEGTGIVHIAPGHGHEDSLIGKANSLEVLSPVDHQGRFTNHAPEFIRDKSVFEANALIIGELRRRGLLLAEEPITHSYPHCWRCKQPVIFRATPQWFLKITEPFRKTLRESAKRVHWIPDSGLNRMSGMLETRPDWCVSRQRYWGTPIPMLHCRSCRAPLLDPVVVGEIVRSLEQRGLDAWFTATAQELAPSARCAACGGTDLGKDENILDVWFDSGVSHEAVLKTRPELRWPAQLYLEGSDQHRGWFQVSLITSVALRARAPYDGVLTHGFVVDGEGRKMSKSLGNVIAPQDVMQRYGADILRLWVASCDYREDVRISDAILGQVAESYRKIRNTFRYVLANLSDFQPARDQVPLAQLGEFDRWVLHRAQALLQAVTSAYDAFQFHEALRAVHQFCVADLSAFYLDALKDRLYTEAARAKTRRCAQTALYVILLRLVKALAPVLAVTTEEVWTCMRQAGWVTESSVHAAPWPELMAAPLDAAGAQRWNTFLALRGVVMKALEERRSQSVIGSPLEALVTLQVSDRALQALCEAHRQTLAEVFVVSEVAVRAEAAAGQGAIGAVPGLVGVQVERASGQKCARCWKHLASVGSQPEHPSLCERCARVVMINGLTGERANG